MRRKANWFWAIPLIVVGVVWQMSNMGVITSDAFHIIVSWQALLMYIGGIQIFRKHYVGGLLTFGIGLLFILPEIGILDYGWLRMNWALALIIAGLVLLIKPGFRKRRDWFEGRYHNGSANEGNHKARVSYSCEEGYVETNNYFGGVKQIVFDPVFKGANIRNVFGGTVLDLRRCSLEDPETYIDVDCVFGGIEIFLPDSWFIQNKTAVILGGCNDERIFSSQAGTDKEHVLVVRGNITFGGVEFKS